MSNETPIPDKLYFKIGEVCEITGVKQHVLRYWESEFRILSPQRAHSRQRLYRRVDVENVLRIKRLLKVEGFTIGGAKKLLGREGRRRSPDAAELPTQPPPVSVSPVGISERGANEAASAQAVPGPDTSPLREQENLSVPSGFFAGLKQELLDLKKILDR